MSLEEYLPGQIWLADYPVNYAGTRFLTRMTVLRLKDGGVFIHSPVWIDEDTERQINEIGPVQHIVAPGTFHHLFFSQSQRLWPRAKTYACMGLPQKRPDLRFDAVLTNEPEPAWAGELEQVLTCGNGMIREMVFFHRSSRTLIVVDLLENFSEKTPGTDWLLRVWMRIFGTWNRPGPAPEYLLFTWDKRASEQVIQKILDWDFERIVMAHGDLLEGPDVKDTARRAWIRLTRQFVDHSG